MGVLHLDREHTGPTSWVKIAQARLTRPRRALPDSMGSADWRS